MDRSDTLVQIRHYFKEHSKHGDRRKKSAGAHLIDIGKMFAVLSGTLALLSGFMRIGCDTPWPNRKENNAKLERIEESIRSLESSVWSKAQLEHTKIYGLIKENQIQIYKQNDAVHDTQKLFLEMRGKRRYR